MTAQPRSTAPSPLLVLCIAVAAQTMVGGDFSLASVAMPSIERGLGLTPALSQWLLTVYLIAYAGILIVGGRLTDIFGQKRTLTAGLTLFMAGSIITGMAPDLLTELGARALQGLGGGLIYPAAFSILTIAFPAGEKRFKAYTINMASQAVGTPLLTVVAGWALSEFGWRSAFVLNVPVCLILLVLLTRIGGIGERSDNARREGIPYANAALLTCAMASLIYALSSFVAKAEIMREQAPYALAAALALTLAFVVAERRSAAPLISPALLRTKNFAAGIGLVATIVLVGKGIVILSNISFQKALGFSALQASYALLPMALASLLLIPLSPVTGRYVLPFPKRSLAGVMVIIAFLYAILSVVPVTIAAGVLLSFLFLAPFASVTGVNMALNEALKTIPSEQQGVSTAIIYTVNQMVSAVGIALLVSAPGLSSAEDPFARFAPSFQLGALFSLIGLAIVVFLFKSAGTGPKADAPLQQKG